MWKEALSLTNSCNCVSTWRWRPESRWEQQWHLSLCGGEHWAVALLALCLNSPVAPSCCFPASPLTQRCAWGQVAVSLQLSLSRVSREARCSGRIIGLLMSGGITVSSWAKNTPLVCPPSYMWGREARGELAAVYHRFIDDGKTN